ncbi:MAG: hypothetical protein QOH31_6420 [Verrucomicrobiota bacterium]|jgi:hypothetical protein
MGLSHFGRTLIQWRCQSRRLRDKDFDRRDRMSSGWTPPSPEQLAAALRAASRLAKPNVPSVTKAILTMAKSRRFLEPPMTLC